MALKSCTEMSSVNVKNSSVLELKRRLKNLCHLTKHTDIVERLGSLMSDDLVASWVCGGLSLAAKKLAGYELKQCRNAGKTVIGELKEMVKVQDYRKMATQLQLYAVKVAVVVLPLPPPLGRIIEQGVHLRLQRLAQDAGEELDSLEKKLDAKIRRTMSRELLRLGTAQARAAEEQVTEMLTLDGLLNDMVSKSSETSSQFATAMAQVTSFNRWAILEHDLATSS
ncbi:unnamed protein product [Durusdinium trenchii]|uniref:Uncharacterized protein n=4 Tax=Durusdinium trenchii TaxID=1381693 RepID=A0ABP0KZ34_9DINO